MVTTGAVMRNQLTTNAARAAGFRVVRWVMDEKLNREMLIVEDRKGTGRYFDPLNEDAHAFELLAMMGFNIKIDEAEELIQVFTYDLERKSYYRTIQGDLDYNNYRKRQVLRELITQLAADHS
jgi:hypothetical protein